MKSNGNGNLQKHYGTFSPRERLALIFAAIARNDDAERRALIDSAPLKRINMPDHNGVASAFNLACLTHICKQLHLAHLQSTLMHWASGDTPEEEETAERYSQAVCMSAYVLHTRADAWRAFCEGLGIDADAALKGLPGVESLEMAETLSRRIAFPPEDVQAEFEDTADLLQLQGELITVESVTAEIRETFENWAARF